MSKDGKITLKIATSAGAYEGVFEVTTKVYELIHFVVKEMKLVEGDEFELAFDGKTLPSDKAIGSLDIKDGAVLDLIASGSAV